jgi:fructose-1,6-bisphosphatase/inositol monophosphatase family enzyme
MTRVEMDAVGEILREAAETVILPYFRTLTDGDVHEKAPGEEVTVADQEAEDFIAARLAVILPGTPVIGEEAVHARPALLDALGTAERAWLVDPLDGTANFAAGDTHWAVMVALVRYGETIASWVYRQTDGRLVMAERGAGTWHNGTRLTCATGDRCDPATLRGAVLARFLSDEEHQRMIPRFDRFQTVIGGYSCAGFEYPAIIDGEQEFALFQRLMPWDHAPGALLLTEAGGVARHPDGVPFRPDHGGRRGLLLASSPKAWDAVRDVLYGPLDVPMQG